MGSQVVRAHTVGVSTGTGEIHAWNMGWEGTVWPERGLTIEENFESMDYAVFRAGQLGPLANAVKAFNSVLIWS